MKKECDAGNVMIKMKKSTRRDEVFSRGAIQITESGEWILFRLLCEERLPQASPFVSKGEVGRRMSSRWG